MTRFLVIVLTQSHHRRRIRVKCSRGKLVLWHIAVILPCLFQCGTVTAAHAKPELVIGSNQSVQSLGTLGGWIGGQLDSLAHRSYGGSEFLAIPPALATVGRIPGYQSSHSATADKSDEKPNYEEWGWYICWHILVGAFGGACGAILMQVAMYGWHDAMLDTGITGLWRWLVTPNETAEPPEEKTRAKNNPTANPK